MLLSVALLIFAASIASFALAGVLATRSKRAGQVLGLSIGTALLCGSIVIFVASTNSWLKGKLGFENVASHPELSTAIGQPTSTGSSSATEPDLSARQVPHAAAPTVNRTVGANEDARRHDAPLASGSVGALSARRTSTAGSMASTKPDSRIVTALHFPPWAATNCVIAVQPDPAEPTKWLVGNECGQPVAILFSARNSGRWEYPKEAMLLPARHQRFIPQSEETQYGEEIRYLACALSSRKLIGLVIGNVDPWPYRSLSEAIEAERENDQCFARVNTFIGSGRTSGLSIDQIVGPGLPGRIRAAR